VASSPFNVPDPVTGDPLTVKILFGSARPTLVTVPLQPGPPGSNGKSLNAVPVIVSPLTTPSPTFRRPVLRPVEASFSIHTSPSNRIGFIAVIAASVENRCRNLPLKT
jgi:hypothetical protein